MKKDAAREVVVPNSNKTTDWSNVLIIGFLLIVGALIIKFANVLV
ncbi:MAG: hypothetical protein ACOVQE_09910 [Chitinophagaceae bacterium]